MQFFSYLCSRKHFSYPRTPLPSKKKIYHLNINIMKRIYTIAAALLLATASLTAMPAWKGKLQKKQSDGSVVTYLLRGDEWGHYLLSTDGLLLEEDEQGCLRYKAADAPIAHNPGMRTAEESRYVEKQRSNLTPSKSFLAPSHPRTTAPSKNAPRKAKASDYQIGSFPTKGDAHGLIILADFSDLKMTFTQEYHQRMMNEEGFSDYDVEGDIGFTGSARDYFIAQSKGQFQPTFDVVGPVPLSRNYAYYGRNDGIYNQDQNAEAMIVEACKLADSQFDIDFSQYDYDHDGYVDMVYVIFAGYGENAGGGANTVWPKKWNLSNAGYNLKIDDCTIDVFACSSELFGNTGTQTASIAQFCHEFGHVLGFADHYSTVDSHQYNLGAYDLMDYGAYNNDSRTPPSYNAFERMSVGWMEPEELSEVADGLQLENILKSNNAYRVSTTRNPQEFYLLENRQQTEWDEFLPGSGLMITHVDFDMQTWNSNVANNDPKHQRFYLVCADNEPGYDVLLEKYSERYDLFPYDGNDAFTDESTPQAKPYTGEKLDKWITNITNTDGLVSFDFMNNHLKAPTLLNVSDMGDSHFTAFWTNNDNRTESYNIRLTHLMREQDIMTAVDEGFDLMTAGSNNNGDTNDIAAQLDLYMTSKGWTGENIFQAGGTMQIGKTGTDGTLTSPKLNLSTYNRDFALLLKVNSMQGKQPALTVTANGLQAKHRLTSTPRMYLYQFNGAGLTATDITISVNKERAFIDSLIIIRGADAAALYPNAKVVDVTGEVASTVDEPFEQQYIPAEQWTMENINDCRYVVTDLTEGECYKWEVQAVAEEMSSRYSDACQIVVSPDYIPTAIDDIATHDLFGRTYNPTASSTPQQGYATIYNIKGTRASDLRQPGVYIVKNARGTHKVIIK